MTIDNVIQEALEVLRKGGLILYPTDTVWGIGCDACNEAAVQKVFKLKRRSGAKSLVLLAADLDMVARYIRKVPPMAVDLVEVNDAPMTIVYPGAIVAGGDTSGGDETVDSKAAGKEAGETGQGKAGMAASGFGLAPSVVAEDGSVGIRIPRADDGGRGFGRNCKGGEWDERPVSAGAVFCNRLIYKLRRPLVSTSANISGEPAPASFKEISEEIRAGVDYVVPAAVSSINGGGAVRFDDLATGRPSQIIKLGLDGEVEIIRA